MNIVSSMCELTSHKILEQAQEIEALYDTVVKAVEDIGMYVCMCVFVCRHACVQAVCMHMHAHLLDTVVTTVQDIGLYAYVCVYVCM